MMSRHDFRGWTALVTGASAGLGEEYARQLAPLLQTAPGDGGRLLLVARREERLAALAAALTTAHPGLAVEVLPVDLSDPAAVSALLPRLAEARIDLLLNNAGLGDSGLFELTPARRAEELLRVNIEALTRLTLHLLPGMVERKRGAIVNVGSVAGFLPLPSRALYAASKAFVNSFSEALYWELRPLGITVTAICPGPVPTEFFHAERRDTSTPPRCDWLHRRLHISAAQAVRESLRTVLAGKPRFVPGGLMRFLSFLLHRVPLALLRVGYCALTPVYTRDRK
ncbi:hypothetical protein SAMN05444156_1799 [Verrucomicrobium sp. GAS474]|uniref:SDR family NAD(P)-dependent oxidoreductase n=1 Tax=Verrucomicrobium sp. GAS474 TaxID=1882831 RepID=UPI00087CA723|nr:SDR family NAD(P)-dependent oxidoreductase [Verrucomicrobium sp. GAS474]SDU07258.1 hypothetical protein SAMN05444156_1799 [Verrucomicrobium sp. GAS474]